MTGLGNVMTLMRELQEDEIAATDEPVGAGGIVFPAACSCVCASSLGDVLGCIREMQDDDPREFVATLPRVVGPRATAAA